MADRPRVIVAATRTPFRSPSTATVASSAAHAAPCPACAGRVPFAERIRKAGYTYTACGRCGLCRLEPIPDPGALARIYARDYFTGGHDGGYADYAGDASTHRRNARTRLRVLDATGTTPGRLLDVGCAAGFLLEEARDAGWEANGADPSAWAADEVRGRLDLPLWESIHGLPHDLDGTFAAVTMFQVLEHLPAPDAALLRARALLDRSGTLVIETWDRSSLVARVMGRHWQQVTPPSVLYLFDRHNLAQMLRRTGFEVVSCRRTSKRVALGFASNLLAAKLPTVFAPVARLVRRLGLEHMSVPYRLGDLITIVARPAR